MRLFFLPTQASRLSRTARSASVPAARTSAPVPVCECSAAFRARPDLPRIHLAGWHESGHRPSRPYPPGYGRVPTRWRILVPSEWPLPAALN